MLHTYGRFKNVTKLNSTSHFTLKWLPLVLSHAVYCPCDPYEDFSILQARILRTFTYFPFTLTYDRSKGL